MHPADAVARDLAPFILAVIPAWLAWDAIGWAIRQRRAARATRRRVEALHQQAIARVQAADIARAIGYRIDENGQQVWLLRDHETGSF